MVECLKKAFFEKNMEDINEYSKNLRKNILYMAKVAGSNSSHIGGALSCIDLISVLFKKYFDFKDINNQDRDRFILSKGHACLALYSLLFEKKILNKEQISSFEKQGTKLLGHPVKNADNGIEFSTGSLGMGLSIGSGIAIALRKKSISKKVYVLLGDGECNEGSVWEAAIYCSSTNLENLTAIIDNNGLQQTGSNKEILDTSDLGEKWRSFGWNVLEIDGHSIPEIDDAFNKKFNNNKPKLILAKTIKGKGVSFFENDNKWHHSILSNSLYEEAISEIENL